MDTDINTVNADTASPLRESDETKNVRLSPDFPVIPYAQELALRSNRVLFGISSNAPMLDNGVDFEAPKPPRIQENYPPTAGSLYARPLAYVPQAVTYGLRSSHDTPRMDTGTRGLALPLDAPTQTERPSTLARARRRETRYAQTVSRLTNRLKFSFRGTRWRSNDRDMEERMSRDHQLTAEPGVARLSPTSDDLETLRPLVLPPGPVIESESGSLYIRLTAKHNFRLLNVLPGRGDEPLLCQLRVCSMAHNYGSYEALSYTWKTDSNNTMTANATIQCNGIEMAVGPNLYTALQHIRLEDKTRTVWVDAICINQEDVGERSEQVAAMGSIFRNAYRVLVWLGVDEDEDSSQFSKTRDAISTFSRAFFAVCSVVMTWAADQERSVLSEPPSYQRRGSAKLFLPGNRILPGDNTVWLDALRLYQRRWFSRLWVVQEIALARKATVVWGSWEMSWEWIGLAAAIIRTNWNRIVPSWSAAQGGSTHHASSRLVPVGVMNAYFMYRISRSQSHFSPLRFSFLDLLTLTRQFQCEDKRDNIFGLLGLPTTDSVSSRIRPDYTQSLADTYRAVASVMVRLPRSLAFLSHVHHTDMNDPHRLLGTTTMDVGKAASDLPSWVPQWHVVGPQSLAPLDAHSAFAAGMLKPAQFLPPDVTATTDRLIVRGMVLEDVTHTREVGSLQPQGAELDSQNLESALEQSSYSTLDLERLAVTLSAGKNWYGVPVAEEGDLVSGFAHCLVSGRLLWALKRDAFGLPEQSQIHEGARESENQGNAKGGVHLAAWEEKLTVTALKNLAATGTGAQFHDAVATACDGRRLFTTASGLRGVGPSDTMPGDKVCIIYGTPVPFVLRQCEEKRGYILVGECYVHEVMRGEAFRWKRSEETWIDLV